jgi:signal transduction histidine kinase
LRPYGPLVITATRAAGRPPRSTPRGRDVVDLARPRLALQRERWMHASTRITRELLAADGGDPLTLIARSVVELADARLVAVVLPTADAAHVMVEVAAGENVEALVGFSFPIAGSLTGRAMSSGAAVTSLDGIAEGDELIPVAGVIDVGPVMAVPLGGTDRVHGALLVARRAGEAHFDALDAEMATAFANHAALALEIADARVDRQRLELLEDRTRIASDLHDHVIQRLFAATLCLHAISAGPETVPSDRIHEVITGIQETIGQIRTTIFGLGIAGGLAGATVRARVLSVATEMAPLLPREPQVHFSGPVDTLVDDDELAADLLAVVREALSNVGRHADASTVRLAVTVADGELVLEVADDGVGTGRSMRCSGLANMRRRALRHGGRMTVSGAGGPAGRPGTRLTWTAHIP